MTDALRSSLLPSPDQLLRLNSVILPHDTGRAINFYEKSWRILVVVIQYFHQNKSVS